jgi:putative flippase GtrA
MDTITLLAVVGAAGVKINDFVRYLKAQDWNGVIGTTLGWAAGIALAFLLANASAFKQIQFGDLPALGKMDGWSLVLLGAGIMSFVQLTGVDIGRKALDGTQSAAVPKLVGGAGDAGDAFTTG